MSAAQTRVYRDGVLEAEGFPVADVSDFLEQPDTVVWVDFCGPSKDQLAGRKFMSFRTGLISVFDEVGGQSFVAPLVATSVS